MMHPSHIGQQVDAAELVRIAKALDAAAADEEAGRSDISESVDLLRQAGWMTDNGAENPSLTAMRLRRLGAANLPVGRLWEGHVNALYLSRVHGDRKIAAAVDKLVAGGAVLGVWGADGETPVVVAMNETSLSGQKTYSSGLGTVTHAVITVGSGPDVRLGLIDVRDLSRADASVWRMRGMRATASGHYDFEGIAIGAVLWLGGPGDYLTEPHFVGGVWRIAALQIGAALGLLEAAADTLRARGRLDTPAQMSRLTEVAIRALGASALTTQAAVAASPNRGRTTEEAVTMSAAARLLTEDVGLDAIRAAEQSLGLAHFEDGSDTGRKARDLSVYLRQAARDAFQSRVGNTMFSKEGTLWTLI